MAEHGHEASATAVAWFEAESAETRTPLRALHPMVHTPLSYSIGDAGLNHVPVQRVWRRPAVRGLRLRGLNAALRFMVLVLLVPLVLISKAMLRSYEG